MRIGIDISQMAYEGTGTATYFRNLVTWLLRVDKKNEYVLFAGALRKRYVFSLSGLHPDIWPLPPTVLDLLWNQLHTLPVEWLIGKIDIFHSSDWTQPSTRALKVAPILDMLVYKYPQSLHPTIVATQKRRLAWVKKEADHIITISKSTKKDIVEILKISPEKISVTYLAPGEEFSPQPKDRIATVRQKYQLDGDYFLTMGEPNSRKNIETVVKAAKEIGANLAIIGHTGLGVIPQSDLPALYSGAKCFVYASRYEGFGLPILEAMACGTSVICGRNSSLPEAAGDAATYVNIDDINDLAESMATIKKTGRERTQARKFSWGKTANETVKIYEEMA